jgi:hypothetical protein
LIIWFVDAHSNSFPLKSSTTSGASSSSTSSATASLIRTIQMRAKLHPASSTRPGAIHICTPDTPICRLRRSLIINMFGNSNRSRIKIHLGESMELRYVLQCFGIDTDNIPISWTGTIKNGYAKQWVWIRKYIEDNDNNNNTNTATNSTSNSTTSTTTTSSSSIGSSIIECPQLNDIIFKKGTSASSHPGNVMFKSMIQLKYEQCTNIPTKSFIKEIIQEIEDQKLRILFWNEDNQWWSSFHDEKQIYKKIEYIVRDFRFSSKKSQTINRRTATTTTTVTGTATSTSTSTSTSTATATATKGGKQQKQTSSKIPAAATFSSTPSTPSTSILPRISPSSTATPRSRSRLVSQDGGTNSNNQYNDQQRKRFKSDDGYNNINFFNNSSAFAMEFEMEPMPLSSSSPSFNNAVESSCFGSKYYSF